jgi:hypothetical protein
MLVSGAALAQPAKPLPQHDAMAFFAGEWTFTGTYAGSSFGPSQAGSLGESCESLGGFFIVCRYHIRSASVNLTGVGILGYNGRDSVYTFTSYESTGAINNSLRGTVRDGVWHMGPRDGRTRVTWTPTSATSYRIKIESTSDGAKWSTVMEGRYDKPR